MRKIKQTSQPRPQGRKAAAAAPVLALAGLVLTAPLAVAEPAAQVSQCAAREAIIERLSVKYEEAPVSLGITATGSLLEVLASPSGSWTIILTLPGGPTCLVTSGEGWRDAPIQLVEDPNV